MKKPALSGRRGLTAIELLEQTTALLRRAPASAFVAYGIGAVPFWLGLLYFLADASQSAFAGERLAGASLGVAILFLWAKCWQCVYASKLRAVLTGEPDEPWDPRRIGRMALGQAIWQPPGLFLRPFALLVTLPFAWISSFFQSLTVLGDGREESGPHRLLARALSQTWLWPWQAHALIGILSAFGIFIWLNIGLVLAAVPSLLKTFLGMETMATRNSEAFLSTTFIASSLALTFLCLDPIWKAAYVLRCFYGASLRSGEDLRAQFRHLRPRASALAAVLLAASMPGGLDLPARGAENTAPGAALLDPSTLDRSIDEVLERREFAWRMPRGERKPPEGVFGTVDRWIREVRAKVAEWRRDAMKWLRERWPFNRKKRDEDRSRSKWSIDALPLREIGYVLLGGCALALAFTAWRLLRARRPKPVTAEAVVPAAPDLHAENIVADQLPEDGWMRLARELMERGDLRLALRAAYLAGLAHLGQRDLLSIARHKSNRDYQRELRRRARSREELLRVFDENLLAFERTWYGRHDVTRDGLDAFTRNLERIRAC